MPSYVLKASPDASEDLYCIYSTIVDAVTVIGTRGEIRQYLLHQDGVNGKPDERLARADKSGSYCRIDSDGTGVWYGWTQESISIGEGPGDGRLPRKDLSAYLGYMEANNNEAAAALVVPETHEDEEQP